MKYAVPYVDYNIQGKGCKINVGGSKSIALRALVTSALGNGCSTLLGISYSDDVIEMIEILRYLGVEIVTQRQAALVYGTCGKIAKSGHVTLGKSGACARFIVALLAIYGGVYTVSCHYSMEQRPLKDLLLALEGIGAKFTYLKEEYSLPFIVNGLGQKCNNNVEVDITKSSQFLSAILLSLGGLKESSRITFTGKHGMSYVEMTKSVTSSFGAKIKGKDNVIEVSGGYKPQSYIVECDISSACYFYAINCLLGTKFVVEGVDNCFLQGDRQFIELLEHFDGGEVDMSSYSDQAITLAVLAPFFTQPTKITGIGHIRGQECDRIEAIYTNLKAMDVEVEYGDDWVKVYPSTPKGAIVKTYSDHRVAMAFTILGLKVKGVIIDDTSCVSKSFPNFLSTLLDALSYLKLS